MSRLIIGFILLLSLKSTASAEENFYTLLATDMSRSIALGGAVTAMVSDPLTTGINPATLRMYSLPGPTRGVLILNPMGCYSLAKAYYDDLDAGERLTTGIRLLVRFVGVSYQFFDLGIRFNDEIFSQADQELIPGKNIYQFHTNSILLRVKLHSLVSFGLNMMGHTHRNKIDQFGYSYGVLLTPASAIQAAVTYIDNPTRYRKTPHPLNRLADECINIGMSAKLPWNTSVNLDLRNITDEDLIAFLEPHLGVEYQPHRHVVMRSGAFAYTHSDRKVLSFGVGVLDWNYLVKSPRRMEIPNFVAQYGVAFEFIDRLEKVWHSLTVGISITL
jgi:hypothetical protein